MSNFKQDTTYIYEHADGVTYARKPGAAPADRFEVDRTLRKQTSGQILKEEVLWSKIRNAAKENKTVQDALERVLLVYYLSQTQSTKTS